MGADYRYLTLSRAAFVAQVIQYASKGYFFYIRCEIPPHKDPLAVDAKMLDRYGIRTKRWQRKKRNRGDAAAIHYLRFERTFVIMLTSGRHDAFYADHRTAVRDLRRLQKRTSSPLMVFGYSIQSIMCPTQKRRKVAVRLEPEAYRKVKEHLLKAATNYSYRDKDRMEREVFRLPYQPYGPVYHQLVSIAKATNRARRRRGFEQVSLSCIRKFRKPAKIFVDTENEQGIPVAA